MEQTWGNVIELFTQDCKGLPGTKALAYNENSQLTAVKSFITFAPRACAVKLYEYVVYRKMTNFTLSYRILAWTNIPAWTYKNTSLVRSP